MEVLSELKKTRRYCSVNSIVVSCLQPAALIHIRKPDLIPNIYGQFLLHLTHPFSTILKHTWCNHRMATYITTNKSIRRQMLYKLTQS